MININEKRLRKEFPNYFIYRMEEEGFIHFFYNIFPLGTAYVVGGFIRDFINQKNSRDIDIIVDIKNEQLTDVLNQLHLEHSTNRYGGIKIKLHSIEADIWSIENNWAFKNKLVKLNDDDKLNSIAKGCFYNYDSLVINLNNFNYNLRYYKDFLENKKLDILQERIIYKHSNPSTEANILRAFYIKYLNNITFTVNTQNYLNSKLGYLWDKYRDPIGRLLDFKKKYPKYELLDKLIIEKSINDLKSTTNSQLLKLFEY